MRTTAWCGIAAWWACLVGGWYQVATGLDPFTGEAAEWGPTKSLIGAIAMTIAVLACTLLTLTWLAWDSEREKRERGRRG
jgi:hypothetical protein